MTSSESRHPRGDPTARSSICLPGAAECSDRPERQQRIWPVNPTAADAGGASTHADARTVPHAAQYDLPAVPGLCPLGALRASDVSTVLLCWQIAIGKRSRHASGPASAGELLGELALGSTKRYHPPPDHRAQRRESETLHPASGRPRSRLTGGFPRPRCLPRPAVPGSSRPVSSWRRPPSCRRPSAAAQPACPPETWR